MKHKNAPNLEWIPWFRYALLLRIDGKQIISLGRFRLSITAENEALLLKRFKGYEPRVVDTKESELKEFSEVYESEKKKSKFDTVQIYSIKKERL